MRCACARLCGVGADHLDHALRHLSVQVDRLLEVVEERVPPAADPHHHVAVEAADENLLPFQSPVVVLVSLEAWDLRRHGQLAGLFLWLGDLKASFVLELDVLFRLRGVPRVGQPLVQLLLFRHLLLKLDEHGQRLEEVPSPACHVHQAAQNLAVVPLQR